MSKSSNKNSLKKIIGSVLAVLILLIGGALGIDFSGDSRPADNSSVIENDTNVVIEGQANEPDSLTFRNDSLLDSHYEKHGIEMGFDSAEEYLAAANAVVQNPDSLHRIEEEDGDDVYFLEDTGEFVVVSVDGYIRTYYYADLDYFNRQ